jgi:hypothetical protein
MIKNKQVKIKRDEKVKSFIKGALINLGVSVFVFATSLLGLITLEGKNFERNILIFTLALVVLVLVAQIFIIRRVIKRNNKYVLVGLILSAPLPIIISLFFYFASIMLRSIGT